MFKSNKVSLRLGSIKVSSHLFETLPCRVVTRFKYFLCRLNIS